MVTPNADLDALIDTLAATVRDAKQRRREALIELLNALRGDGDEPLGVEVVERGVVIVVHPDTYATIGDDVARMLHPDIEIKASPWVANETAIVLAKPEPFPKPPLLRARAYATLPESAETPDQAPNEG